MPAVPVSRFQSEILGQLRRTAALSILGLASDELQDQRTASFRRLLAGIVKQFADDPHWETFAAQAMSLHVDGDFAAASELYTRAIDSIRSDKQIDQRAWEPRVEELRLQRDRSKAKQPCFPAERRETI